MLSGFDKDLIWQPKIDWTFDPDSPYAPVIRDGEPYTGDHHMGTCRMNSSDVARDGVVNSNCKVIDFTNLWVCSTGVYPTGGWANATLTLLALSLRLADGLMAAEPERVIGVCRPTVRGYS